VESSADWYNQRHRHSGIEFVTPHQRWSIENEWHWARDTQLGEDAHRYANRNGAPVFSLLRTVVMILLRRGGYRSIRRALRALSHDIKGMLVLGGVQFAEKHLNQLSGSPAAIQ